jgi:hypothetical protein
MPDKLQIKKEYRKRQLKSYKNMLTNTKLQQEA